MRNENFDRTPGEETRVGSDATARSPESTPALVPLSAMDDFEIVDGEPDIRGWDVYTTEGQKLGEVEDLLVDPQQLKVRYIEVQLEDDVALDENHQYAVLPIGSARLDEDEDTVRVPVTNTQLRGMPPYARGRFFRKDEDELLRRLDSSYERASESRPGGEVGFYGLWYFDERPTFAARRARNGRSTGHDAPYLTRAENRRL